MRYAVIVQGVVEGVYLVDQAWVDAHPDAVAVADGVVCGPGYSYSNGNFAAPDPPADVVPASVTRRQARQVLVMQGYSLAAVDAAINALPQPQQDIARIFWQDAADFERDNAILNALAPALNISQAQLDALFIAAAQL